MPVRALRLFGIMWLAMLGASIGVGLAITHSAAIDRWDLSANRWFADHRSAHINGWTYVGSHLANTLPVIAIAIVVCLALYAWRRRWHEPLLLASALVMEVTVFLLTTLFVHRDRPDVPRLDLAPPTSSFPSGHTAASVALYGGLAVIAFRVVRPAVVRWSIIVIGALVPIGVALSRLSRGMHHPTDVLWGAVLGGVSLATGAAVARRWCGDDTVSEEIATPQPSTHVSATSRKLEIVR